MRNKKIYAGVAVVLVIALVAMIIPFGHSMSPQEKREKYISLESELHEHHLNNGDYACCLKRPCHTCLILDPYHGKEGTCTCLEDVVNGEAPCGECVGGILAGRGNELLAEYFVDSISEGIGERDAVERIIAEKYGLSGSEVN